MSEHSSRAGDVATTVSNSIIREATFTRINGATSNGDTSVVADTQVRCFVSNQSSALDSRVSRTSSRQKEPGSVLLGDSRVQLRELRHNSNINIRRKEVSRNSLGVTGLCADFLSAQNLACLESERGRHNKYHALNVDSGTVHAVTTRHSRVCSLQRLKRKSLSVSCGCAREECLVDALCVEQGREHYLIFQLRSTSGKSLRNLGEFIPVLIYDIFPGEGEHPTILVILDLDGAREKIGCLVFLGFVHVDIVDVACEGSQWGRVEGRQARGLRYLLPLGFVATVQVEYFVLECAANQGGEVASSQRFLQACLCTVPATDTIAEDGCGFCYALGCTSVAQLVVVEKFAH
nr:MAG TPA: hypothetical protein [Caudoviricetes sp.]